MILQLLWIEYVAQTTPVYALLAPVNVRFLAPVALAFISGNPCDQRSSAVSFLVIRVNSRLNLCGLCAAALFAPGEQDNAAEKTPEQL
jgi:hypothetical protein